MAVTQAKEPRHYFILNAQVDVGRGLLRGAFQGERVSQALKGWN